MFRKPNSTMTAVEIVSSMYDGPIPAEVLIEARAEDARYAQHPAAFEAAFSASQASMSLAQLAHCRSMVRAKVADVRRAVTARDRELFCSGVRHWMRKYRTEQRNLCSLIQGAA